MNYTSFFTTSFDVVSNSPLCFVAGKIEGLSSLYLSLCKSLFLDLTVFTVALNSFVISAMLSKCLMSGSAM